MLVILLREEARAIEKEIRTANPTLTADDKIEVKRKGNTGAAVATVTLANGKVDQMVIKHMILLLVM